MRAYRDRFPALEKLPRFGYVRNGTFSLGSGHRAQAGRADAQSRIGKNRQRKPRIEEKAAAAGIAIVYLDFRVDPEKNSENSIALLGEHFRSRGESQGIHRLSPRADRTCHRTACRGKARLCARKSSSNAPRESPAISPAAAHSGRSISARMVELGGGHNIGTDVISDHLWRSQSGTARRRQSGPCHCYGRQLGGGIRHQPVCPCRAAAPTRQMARSRLARSHATSGVFQA